METFFYVIGGVLVLIALAISFLGMRSERFPSDGVLRLGIVFVAIVVLATAYGAVQTSQDEAQKRETEQNHAADTAAEESAVQDADASGVQETGGTQAPGNRQESDTQPAGSGSAQAASGDAQAGAEVFQSQGCASCHTLQAAGATGTIGPNLDTERADEDTKFIETSIVDPSAFVAKGFQDGIMPSDYGDTLTPDDIANVVAYLSESTGGGAASSSGSK